MPTFKWKMGKTVLSLLPRCGGSCQLFCEALKYLFFAVESRLVAPFCGGDRAVTPEEML